jgi:hypothetical protein
MKSFAVWLLGIVLVPVVALAQAPAADVNTITGVQVNGGTVTITGTKKPNFTTFTMTDPPRLVIDVSEAVFSGVPEELAVGNGTVTGIRTASYGSDASAIARVLIGYDREVETDIQANGNQLVVRVAGGGGQAVAEAPAQPAPTEAAQPAPAAAAPTDGTAAQAAAAAEADRQAQEKAAAAAAAAAQAERQAQEKAAAEAAARAQQDADAERKRQEEARAEAQRQEEARAAAQAAEDKKRQEADARASAQASAEDKKRQEDEARAAAQAAAEEKKRQEDEARAAAQAAAEEKKRQEADARASAKSAAQTAADERRAAAEAAAEERRAAAQAAADERRAAAEAAAEERRASRSKRQPEAVAMATPSERREVSRGSGGSAEVSSRRKTMTLVGFQQQSGASRVFVRTNEPVRYTVSEEGGTVVLELENTRIDLSNNTRPLDTSFFSSPVTRVEADASGRAVRVTIQRRQQGPYEARQDGNVISLDFQRAGR